MTISRLLTSLSKLALDRSEKKNYGTFLPEIDLIANSPNKKNSYCTIRNCIVDGTVGVGYVLIQKRTNAAWPLQVKFFYNRHSLNNNDRNSPGDH
jgi:hypothetical protein